MMRTSPTPAVPAEKYARAPEILAHRRRNLVLESLSGRHVRRWSPTSTFHCSKSSATFRAIGERYGLYANACFQTEVIDLRWDEDAARWIVSTNRGDSMKARFVCMPTGPLNRPKLPGIPGIESFTGHSFHTSRWDYACTGGDSSGNLTGLRGKRVGIIGTGATAV